MPLGSMKPRVLTSWTDFVLPLASVIKVNRAIRCVGGQENFALNRQASDAPQPVLVFDVWSKLPFVIESTYCTAHPDPKGFVYPPPGTTQG